MSHGWRIARLSAALLGAMLGRPTIGLIPTRCAKRSTIFLPAACVDALFTSSHFQWGRSAVSFRHSAVKSTTIPLQQVFASLLPAENIIEHPVMLVHPVPPSHA